MYVERIICDGPCKKEAHIGKTEGWIAVEQRGNLLSISTDLYSCSSYKHYCKDCAETGIER